MSGLLVFGDLKIYKCDFHRPIVLQRVLTADFSNQNIWEISLNKIKTIASNVD
jgi:hypothetical protein